MCFHIGPVAPAGRDLICDVCGVTVPEGDPAGLLHDRAACAPCVAAETEREWARFTRAYRRLIERGAGLVPSGPPRHGPAWAMRL